MHRYVGILYMHTTMCMSSELQMPCERCKYLPLRKWLHFMAKLAKRLPNSLKRVLQETVVLLH